MNTVNCRASRGASFGIGPNARLHNAPSTRITAGPVPDRSNAMVVPSFEMTFSMKLSSDESVANAQRNDGAEPGVPQVEPSPDQDGDVDREEGVAEKRIADPPMGGN